MARLQDTDKSAGTAGKGRRQWFFLGIQLVPLLVMMMMVAACGGGGTNGIGGLGFDIRTDITLSGFFLNTNDNTVTTDIKPSSRLDAIEDNIDARPRIAVACTSGLITFPQFFARLQIGNGIGVLVQQIAVEFTEVTGQPLTDLSAPLPVSRAGEFDFIINTHVSVPANPVTSVGNPLQDPFVAQDQQTRIFIPIQLNQTDIFCRFVVNQPAPRPVMAKLTIRGVDILNNPFSLVGFMLVSPLFFSLSQ